MTKRERELRKVARAHGLVLSQARRTGHYKLRTPDGRLVTVASLSPSDGRALRNMTAHVRAASRT